MFADRFQLVGSRQTHELTGGNRAKSACVSYGLFVPKPHEKRTNHTITRTRKISILDVDIDSNVKEREVALGCALWLDNTIAGHLYPNLKMALVRFWDKTMFQFEQAR